MTENCNTLSVLHTTLICFVLLFSTNLALDNKKYIYKILKLYTHHSNVDSNSRTESEPKMPQHLYSCEELEINHYDQDYIEPTEPTNISCMTKTHSLSDDWCITGYN